MPEDAGVNGLAPHVRVREMQTKLHRWAVADPGRRFDDLYNLVCDPAFLLIAWERVAGNSGARTAGVDRYTVRGVIEQVGGRRFWRTCATSCGTGRIVRCRCGSE